MSWKDILKLDMEEARKLGEKYAPKDMEEARTNKNKKAVSNIIRLAQDNMDKFDKEEKELIGYYIKSLEGKYDKNTFTALKFELGRKDLLRRGSPDYGTYQERKERWG